MKTSDMPVTYEGWYQAFSHDDTSLKPAVMRVLHCFHDAWVSYTAEHAAFLISTEQQRAWSAVGITELPTTYEGWLKIFVPKAAEESDDLYKARRSIGMAALMFIGCHKLNIITFGHESLARICARTCEGKEPVSGAAYTVGLKHLSGHFINLEAQNPAHAFAIIAEHSDTLASAFITRDGALWSETKFPKN